MSISVKQLTSNDNLNNNNEDDQYDEEYDSTDFGDFDDHSAALDDFNDDDSDNFYSTDPERFDYDCFPIEKIDWILEKKCEKIISTLKLENPYDAIFLLKQFKWNSQKIVDIFNKDNQSFLEAYFSDNNNNKSNTATSSTSVVNQNNLNFRSSKLDSFINIFSNESTIFRSPLKSKELVLENKKSEPGSLHYCGICCTNKLEMSSLDDCSHFFCLECWRLHFESLICLGNTSVFECMETKCKVIASKDFVLNCLERPFETSEYLNPTKNNSVSSQERKNFNYLYRKLVAIDLIKESEDVMLCPGENKSQTMIAKTASSNNSKRFESYVYSNSKKCSFIVWAKSNSAARRVICTSCNTQFCFLCSLPYHAPNACQIIRKWLLKCQDDSETRNYLLVHTQDCPKCNVCIEKNGGCSHMTCNRCKHEFCWICLNDWKTHGASYDCNRYKGNPELDNAREALNRYTHYYHRWINHSNSLKFEKAFKEQCELRIQEKIMNKGGGTLVDWEFLTEAADLLTKARYTLQYTYPYAYYLESNETKLLFENIQAELERDVENLSHSLEKVNLNEKFNIKTQMNIVETRRKTLLKDFIQ